jgi:two-component system, OmpR family, sensor kinase
MFRKNWVTFLLLFLPLVGGVIAFALVSMFSQSLAPFMVRADFGFVGFVLGVTIRNLGVVALLIGMFITGVLLMLYQRSQRRGEQTRVLIDMAKYEAEQGRRRFLRRLDHELKNPLTGLRAALVNMQEAQASTDRQRAVENAGHAVERLTRLLTDLRKLSDLGERPIELWQVDVPDLLQDVVEAAHSLPAYKGAMSTCSSPKCPRPSL